MKYAMRDFHDGIEVLLRDDNLKTVTVFCSPLSEVKQRIRFTRRQKNEIVITFGRPNYSEREFLALCKKAKCSPRRLWLKTKTKMRRSK